MRVRCIRDMTQEALNRLGRGNAGGEKRGALGLKKLLDLQQSLLFLMAGGLSPSSHFRCLSRCTASDIMKRPSGRVPFSPSCPDEDLEASKVAAGPLSLSPVIWAGTFKPSPGGLLTTFKPFPVNSVPILGTKRGNEEGRVGM